MNIGMRMVSLNEWIADILAAKGLLGVNIDIAIDALRKTAIDFCSQTTVWDHTSIFTSQANVADYPIEILPESRVASVAKVFVNGLELKPAVTATPYWTWPRGTDPNTFYSPGYSTYVVEGKDFVWVVPVPQDDVTVIEVRTSLKPTQTACNLPNFFYEDHNDALTAGTAFRLFSIPKQEFTNSSLAMMNYKLYTQEKARARQFKAQGNTQGAMILTGSYF